MPLFKALYGPAIQSVKLGKPVLRTFLCHFFCHVFIVPAKWGRRQALGDCAGLLQKNGQLVSDESEAVRESAEFASL